MRSEDAARTQRERREDAERTRWDAQQGRSIAARACHGNAAGAGINDAGAALLRSPLRLQPQDHSARVQRRALLARVAVAAT